MSDDEHGSSRRTVLRTSGLALAGGLVGVPAVSAIQQNETETAPQGGQPDQGRQEVEQIVSNWEQKQREEAMNTMEKYGAPEGVTQRRLLWYDVGPWTRIEIFRDATMHNFPKPHPDFFEQFINYEVPSHKADELQEFDGSVFFERTTGIMSARCHTEWANFLALNLANDIVTDEKTVEEARRAYAETVIQYESGQQPEYTQGLQFEVPQEDVGDPDVAVIENGRVNLQQHAPDVEGAQNATNATAQNATDGGTTNATDGAQNDSSP